MTSAAHVHSLLHVNLNTADVQRSQDFYTSQLGMTVGMQTAPDPVDGALLGLSGITRSTAAFLYDDRGPRTAPAIESLEWHDPLPVGTVPGAGRLGIAALGFVAPRALGDLVDPDGVAVEVVQGEVPAVRLAYLRLNVSDVDRTAAFYERVGFVRDGMSLRQGQAHLELGVAERSEPPIAPANHLGLYRMALGVDDVMAAHAELAAEGPVSDPIWAPLPGTRLGGMNILFLSDPDGITVELVERPRTSMRPSRD